MEFRGITCIIMEKYGFSRYIHTGANRNGINGAGSWLDRTKINPVVLRTSLEVWKKKMVFANINYQDCAALQYAEQK
jgi:hypothetical protein